MQQYQQLRSDLEHAPKTWLITGVAGFIGSNLLEALLRLNQSVRGLDNFLTGRQSNLEQVRGLVSPDQWSKFDFREGDIRNPEVCAAACAGVDFVLHQAALGSVPRSIEEPLGCHENNATGFLNVLGAARNAGVKRVVYASSSSVYGSDPTLPKVEEKIGKPLSPYAASKAANELYADAFFHSYGLDSIGLRYFNVFGPRQDPAGAYAAVIPKWISALLKRENVLIYGDGETSRDFCYIENVVQANLLAATVAAPEARNRVYNIAVGERTTLNQLFGKIQEALRASAPGLPEQAPAYRDFRAGDVRHSLADISKARQMLGYAPTHTVDEGLRISMDWYRRQ